MLNRFQGWRERGWSVVDAPVYNQAWQRFGGSVATHPQVIERLAGLADIPVPTLRVWESRYQAFSPDKTSGRHRLYSDEDLLVLIRAHGLEPGSLPPSERTAQPGADAA